MSYHIGDIKILRHQFYAIFNYEKVDPKDNLEFFRILHRERIQYADTIDVPWTQMVRGGVGLYFYELSITNQFRNDITYTVEYYGVYADDMSVGTTNEEFDVVDERQVIEDYLMYAKTCNIGKRNCCSG